MQPLPRSHSRSEPFDPVSRWAFVVVCAVWLAAVLTGGSARADVIQVAFVRTCSIVAIAALFLRFGPQRLAGSRAPLLFGASLVVLVMLQLIPLPHGLWTILPGRMLYDNLKMLPEVGPAVWRPISLTPDLTWNTLVSFLPPFAMLISAPLLGNRQIRWVLFGLAATILLSGVLGVLQSADGLASSLRWYAVTNADSAVGFFANRNHAAIFLAMGIPLVAWWLTIPARTGIAVRAAAAACVVAFLFLAAVTTQSRSGLLICGFALLVSIPLFLREQPKLSSRFLVLGGAGGSLFVLAAVIAASRMSDRMHALSVNEDLRVKVFPQVLEAVRTYFPFGAGFGSFDHAFRRFESARTLGPNFVNHSHMELTNIAVEAGIFAWIALAVFLFWLFRASYRMWRAPQGELGARGRLYSVLIAIPLLGSVFDYPIRTPLIACAFVLLAGLLYRADTGQARSSA